MRKNVICSIGLVTTALFLTGCSPFQGQIMDGDGMVNSEMQTSEDEEKTMTEADAEEEPAAAKLSKEQCEEEVDKLLQTEPVHPDHAATLKAMADCATCAGTVDQAGVVFYELDEDRKTRLRYRFLQAVMWGDSDLYEEIAVVLDDDRRGIFLADAKELFRDAYGDGEFAAAAHERIEDGYLIPEFGDGEAVDLVMAAQYFEDDGYILLSGPMFYESNGEGEKYEGCADILFEKNPDSRFGVTLLYGRLRDVSIGISSVETSSELPPSGGKTYSGDNLIDGDPSTVWVEGVPGTGVGETITLHLDQEQPVYGIQIVTGYTASYEQYVNNGMPTDLEVDFGGGAVAEAHDLEGYAGENFSSQDLADMNRFRIGLDEPVVTDTVTIRITGAKKGEKYDDTCVSEVLVYGPGTP